MQLRRIIHFLTNNRKTFIGIDIEHRFSEKFILGGTYLNVSEKPITPKVNFGGEPIDNVMLGLNLDYSAEVPYLTKLANKLPFVETDAAIKCICKSRYGVFITWFTKWN